MVKINSHYFSLSSGYLFAEIEKRVQAHRQKNPQKDPVNLGIGDVSLPLAPSIAKALAAAAEELTQEKTHRGYGPAEGYAFLKEAVFEHEYKKLKISSDEIFIGAGTKNDIAHFQELFSSDVRIAICDPTYPVYRDSNILAGREHNIEYLPCMEDLQFLPSFPKQHCDIIYLCSPNNPTGIAYPKAYLKKWIDYALEHNALILFDGAYEAFIQSKDTVHSIYEIEEAKKVAVEFRSFSKMAGFTSLRCSYTIVPKELLLPLHPLWTRYSHTKFGAVAYPIQKAAQAVYSSQGQQEIQKQIDSYMSNTKKLKNLMEEQHIQVYGGTDCPYLWCKTPNHLGSWEFFDYFLKQMNAICIPGEGFGKSGEGFFRLSGFCKPAVLDNFADALSRAGLTF